MIFKRDNLGLGIVLGVIAPILGLMIFVTYKLGNLTLSEGFQFMMLEPGFRMFSAALSLSLLLNAVLFTIYINTNRDITAKGVFIATMLYGAVILIIKTVY